MMPNNPAQTVGTARPGGRTARTREAVLRAVRQLLVDEGVQGVRMDRIAKLSGVHRSSIYRRWANPARIIADLAADIGEQFVMPETGTLTGDLESVASELAEQLSGDGAELAAAVLSWKDDTVRQALESFWKERRETVARILEGHGCDADPQLVVRLIAGPLYYEALVERTTPSDSTARAVIESVSEVVSGRPHVLRRAHQHDA